MEEKDISTRLDGNEDDNYVLQGKTEQGLMDTMEVEKGEGKAPDMVGIDELHTTKEDAVTEEEETSEVTETAPLTSAELVEVDAA